MATRRGFLTGLAAAGILHQPSWAAVGKPAFLSAARTNDGAYVLFGITGDGDPVFQIPIPDRGHAAAAHPERAEAIAFARRPGRFAIALDCLTGTILGRLTAPQGRHFYGHGTYSADGRFLYTTENDFEGARGIVGIWDTGTFKRVGEFPSGGIGPHDILLVPNQDVLVVANGGIETHPDSGRVKLNLPFMKPNLTYLSLDGDIIEEAELSADIHMNSIRHLDVRKDGLVGFATQWQGDRSRSPSVVGLHKRGTEPRLLATTQSQNRAMHGYGGSVTFYANGSRIAVSSPRGGIVQTGDIATVQVDHDQSMPDVCGLGVSQGALRASTGNGAFFDVGRPATRLSQTNLAWDNHLVKINRS